jgi:hypothetical protein
MLPKPWFSRDLSTLDGSGFYSTHTGDLDAPIREAQEGDRGPLKSF